MASKVDFNSASVEKLAGTQSQSDSDDAKPEIDPAAERKLLLKLDLIIYPVFIVMYMLSFLDRISISNARIQGMVPDLDLVGNRFNIALFVFYVSYVLLEVPSNIIIKRVRPSLYLSGMTFLWGITSMCMGFVHNYQALVGLRFLLGVFEAGVLPGIVYVTSMYYKRHELQRRLSILMLSTVLAGAFGGLLAYLITTRLGGRYGIAGWRWIFIVEGAMTAGFGLVAAFLVIDWPEQTRYLNDAEKDLLRRRLATDGGDVCRMDTLDKPAIRRIVKDYKIWLGGFIYMGITVAGLSAAFFLPLIIKEFQYTAEESQLRTIPVYVVSAGTMLIAGWASDKLKHRFGFIVLGTVISTVGYAMLLAQDGHSREYKFSAVFLILGGTSMNTPMALTWLQNNLSGHWKRSVGASGQVALGNLGGIIASNIFLDSERPHFQTGYGVCLALIWLSVVLGLIMELAMARENRKRDAGGRDDRLALPKDQVDNLGDDHPSFRFTL